ncbi:MAG: sigma-70 family RNA polymerase sigma factor [Candidatus Obscuribacterales bacterium]
MNVPNQLHKESHLRLVPQSQTLSDLDDVELVLLCQRGNERAFDLLARRHQKFIAGQVYRLAPDWDNHADLAQEVMIRMWRHIKRLKNPRALKTWIGQIAKHLFYDELRKKPRSMRLVSMDEPIMVDGGENTTRDLPDRAAGPAELAERRELTAVVADAMQQLPEQFRQAIMLRDVEQLSYEEIAALMSTELGTVKSRIARARAKVQTMINPYLDRKVG